MFHKHLQVAAFYLRKRSTMVTRLSARGGANLLKQVTQAHCVAGRAAEARDGVDAGKFTNGRRQSRSLHVQYKFQWRFRRPSRETAALQKPQ
jgi:hypothetical protein